MQSVSCLQLCCCPPPSQVPQWVSDPVKGGEAALQGGGELCGLAQQCGCEGRLAGEKGEAECRDGAAGLCVYLSL